MVKYRSAIGTRLCLMVGLKMTATRSCILFKMKSAAAADFDSSKNQLVLQSSVSYIWRLSNSIHRSSTLMRPKQAQYCHLFSLQDHFCTLALFRTQEDPTTVGGLFFKYTENFRTYHNNQSLRLKEFCLKTSLLILSSSTPCSLHIRVNSSGFIWIKNQSDADWFLLNLICKCCLMLQRFIAWEVKSNQPPLIGIRMCNSVLMAYDIRVLGSVFID